VSLLALTGAITAAAVLFGKLLLLLVGTVCVFCAFIVALVANDIMKTLRIKKERRGVHTTRSMPVR
jgi:hypothetical protein